jgi:hypothetical protein
MLASVSLFDDTMASGAAIQGLLWDLLERHLYPDDERSVWVAGCMVVALEHHEAISLLIKRQLTGSAFALVRPLVDSVMRSLWINKVASDDQVKRARDDDKYVFPPMPQMCEAVRTAYGDDKFFQFTSAWDAMHSYTHSGARQIAGRYTGTDLKPSYTEGAKIQALNLTNNGVLFLATKFFESTGHQLEADAIKQLRGQP